MRSVVLFLLLLIPLQIWAEEWKIVGDAQFEPYSYFSPDNEQPQGLDVNMIKAVMAEAKIDYKLRLYPWGRLKRLLEKGRITAAFPFAGTEERRLQYELVGPIRHGVTVFMVTASIDLQDWKSFDDFAPYTIGQVKGFSYQSDFDHALLTRNNYANTPQQLVSMLLAGRIEVIVGDKAQLVHWVEKRGAQQHVRLLPTPLVTMPRYVAFQKGNLHDARRFSQALERLRANGMLDKIYRDLP
jgi:polar amino acid transport system substrate-binding protein